MRWMHCVATESVAMSARAPLELIEAGLIGIRDLVRSTLATYRMDKTDRLLSDADLADLQLLLEPEAKQKDLDLIWHVALPVPLRIPAVAVRDALLNLIINACRASPAAAIVTFGARVEDGSFIADISDSGPGLPSAVRAYIEQEQAGAIPPEQGRGLGLWIVKRHCDEIGARLSVVSSDMNGTTLRLTVPIRVSILRHAA